MSAGLVSCIVPAWNAERFIREAITSILLQTHRPIEVIVVDDGSTDDTAAVVAAFGRGVRLIHQPNQGPAAARNTGIAAATGEFVAFLDADDTWHPDKLERQLHRFGERPDLSVVFAALANVAVPDAAGDTSWFRAEQWPNIPFSPCTMLARRQVFQEIGGFDPALRRGEDTEWFVRMMMRSVRYEVMPDVVLERRVHGANLTAAEPPSPADVVRMLKVALDRRRREGW